MLHRLLDMADGIELAFGENVVIDEQGGQSFFPPMHIVSNPLIEEKTAGFQESIHGREIPWQILQADMLKHAEAGHLVVNFFARVSVVVSDLDGDQIL
ncbi:hypothetical protein D3C85_588700 [compost metagenome]